ncbi:MAG: methyltransferase domain-containing protein [Anaerolineaceae bacterium]|jgi:ubiquinone/menaquinone biosynthesis C-methylase UbiE
MMKRVNYNEVARVYDQRYSTNRLVGIEDCLQTWTRQVKARRVLEVGCGTGHWLTSLRECDFRCGLDYSAGMLGKARQKDGALRLVQGTAMQSPFGSDAFDLVFCINAIHHFPDPAVFIQEARRILKKGGLLTIIGMDPLTEPDRWYLYDYFPGTCETDRGRYPSGKMIQQWMKEAGFQTSERQPAGHINHDFVGREVLDDPILQKNGTSQLALLTDDAFQAGMARIMEAVQLAESCGEQIVFPTHIALPAVIGYA